MNRSDYKLTIKETLSWALGRRQRFSVKGESMEPVLKETEDVLIRKYKKGERAHAGDIVIVAHPKRDIHIVKVIHAIRDDRIELRGVNADKSIDSRHFGAIEEIRILGKMTVILG